MQTVDFVPHNLHKKCITRGSVNEPYEQYTKQTCFNVRMWTDSSLISNFSSLFPSGLQPTENVKGQRRLSVIRPRPRRSRLQSGRRPARGATRSRLLSGTTTARQKKFKGERVSTVTSPLLKLGGAWPQAGREAAGRIQHDEVLGASRILRLFILF